MLEFEANVILENITIAANNETRIQFVHKVRFTILKDQYSGNNVIIMNIIQRSHMV